MDKSLARARELFGRHFADLPADAFHCHSWLLDPHLAEVLPEDSNIVRFQQRWKLYGDAAPGDDDAVFFVFRRRNTTPKSRAALPRDTTLQRAILDRIEAGAQWQLRHGRIPITTPW